MAVAGTALNNTEVPADPAEVIVCVEDPAIYRRIEQALAEDDLRSTQWLDAPTEIATQGIDPSSIVVFVCSVDHPREIAALRSLRRGLRETGIVVISPPATGTGVRRALDAGADALVFEPDLEPALGVTVRAVASGQSVVPRKLRATVERPPLSHREREVLTLVLRGLTNAQIADRLFLSESTIKSHLSSAFAKLGVRSRKEAAALFLELESSANREDDA